jgi:thiamine pyrophosphate-dependent acetolactate synthase large subunit-like protein
MALAKAYGAEGHRVKDVKGLHKVLKKIAVRAPEKSRKPILVELLIPKKTLAGQMGRLGEE